MIQALSLCDPKRFSSLIIPSGAENLIFVDDEVEIGPGTTLYPFTILEGKTYIGGDCIILPGAHIRDSNIARSCTIRGEITRCVLDQGVKAKHTCYLGDAQIGYGVNIGAGTRIGNFNGERKGCTEIGPETFIGIGVDIVAGYPVRIIGYNVYIAAGLTIRENVADDMFVGPTDNPLKHKIVPNEFHKVGGHWVQKIAA